MICEHCNCIHNGAYGSGRFCSSKCARKFSSLIKRDIVNKKVSETMKGRRLTEEQKQKRLQSPLLKKRSERICTGCGKVMLCRDSDKRTFCELKCRLMYYNQFKDPFKLYREQCKFKFNVSDYPDKFNLRIIKELGWYSPANKGNNINGVSKDHMLSVKDGFLQKIDPKLISHPANCQLLPHRDNQRKKDKSDINIIELIKRIEEWESDSTLH